MWHNVCSVWCSVQPGVSHGAPASLSAVFDRRVAVLSWNICTHQSRKLRLLLCISRSLLAAVEQYSCAFLGRGSMCCCTGRKHGTAEDQTTERASITAQPPAMHAGDAFVGLHGYVGSRGMSIVLTPATADFGHLCTAYVCVRQHSRQLEA